MSAKSSPLLTMIVSFGWGVEPTTIRTEEATIIERKERQNTVYRF
jgi:hypothetical protein